MNRIRYLLRNSLAAKVILSTIFLSLGVVWLTGSALYSQLSSGVREVNLETSLAEARSSFFNAQYQFLLVQDKSTSKIQNVTQEVLKVATQVGVNQGRKDVVLLRIENTLDADPRYKANLYNFASDGIALNSIPKKLRKSVLKSGDIAYSYAELPYLNGNILESLIVGKRISIPKSRTYEMYLIYSLTNQRTTLSLITNALLLTGIALILSLR